MFTASLPMYDFPEVRDATDALWHGLRRHFEAEGVRDVPQSLVHDVPLQTLWSDQDLFFSQCCGYDIVHGFQGRLQVLATPCFAAPGCAGGDYASTVVVPEDSQYQDVLDMYDTVAVINGAESHSGVNALFGLVAPHSQDKKFFSRVKISGSHAASLATVQKRKADVASIDCITYALLQRHRPTALAGTRVLGFTCAAPAPPYVTRHNVDPIMVKRMKDALRKVFADPSLSSVRESLLLDDVKIQSADVYQRIASEFRHDLTAC